MSASFGPQLPAAPALSFVNYIGILQEHAQQLRHIQIRYEDTQTGPSHCPLFESTVFVDGVAKGHGEGSTKKGARHDAARDAAESLGLLSYATH